MEKTIEKPFLDGYSRLVSHCIDWVDTTYNLGLFVEGTPKEALSPEWQERYEKVLPQMILDQMAALNCTVVTCDTISPIIEEIDDNLNSTPTVEAKERYIFSLLRPFGELMGKLHPVAEIERLKQRAADSQTEIERVEYVSRQYWEIATKPVSKGTVEYCLSALCGVACQFANRLDALLLTHGLDLLRLERESGIYLKLYREITDVEYYIGSEVLAKKYIDALPKTGNSVPQRDEPELPEELKTEKARALITKTVEAGFITIEAGQYIWNGEKVLLAYYAVEATGYLGLKKKSDASARWMPFETLFNVTNLRGSKADYEKYHTVFKPGGATDIDKLFLEVADKK